MGTVETMMMQTCVLLALCAAAQAAMPWTASLTKLNSAEFTSLASIGMTSSEWNQPTSGTSFPSSGVIQTNSGGYYVDTKETFHRPVDMSVELYQIDSSNECGVVALFPQNTNRHSGYNAGVGWWAHYFGAGVDGSITNYGTDGGATSGWQTVRINAANDGKVYYYLGGSLKYTATDNNYQSGIIRLGNNCRNFQYRNLVVTTNTDAPTPSPTPNPTENPTTKPPSPSPSHTPTEHPTRTPTRSPTRHPTRHPTRNPTLAPTHKHHRHRPHRHHSHSPHRHRPAVFTSASQIYVGDRFIQLGQWRIGDADGTHFSIAYKSGSRHYTAVIFRKDGTVHNGPRRCCGLAQLSTWG